jgi:hypothetical protein
VTKKKSFDERYPFEITQDWVLQASSEFEQSLDKEYLYEENLNEIKVFSHRGRAEDFGAFLEFPYGEVYFPHRRAHAIRFMSEFLGKISDTGKVRGLSVSLLTRLYWDRGKPKQRNPRWNKSLFAIAISKAFPYAKVFSPQTKFILTAIECPINPAITESLAPDEFSIDYEIAGSSSGDPNTENLLVY